MKTLFVHIGMPKTGTTAIQNFCYENQKILNQKGYDYPKFAHIYGDTIARVRNGHFLVPEEIAQNKEVFQKNMALVMERFQTVPNIILSDEAIWTPAAKCKVVCNALKEESAKGGFQVKVILYLRRQDQYLSSIWNQYVKGKNETKPWDEFVQNPSQAGKMNYATNLKQITSILGKDAVTVRRFEPKRFIGGSIYADFLQAVGLEMTEEFVLSKYVRNEKLSGNTHEIMRIINGMPGVDREKAKFFSRILLSYADVSGKEYPSEMFSKEEAEIFMKKYQKENKRVSEEFFDGEELFSMEWKDLPKWKKDNPHMPDDMIRFMAACCMQMKEENKRLEEKVDKLSSEIHQLKHPFRSIRKKASGKVKRRSS